MNAQTAYSTKPLPDAVADLRSQLGGLKPKVAVFFASAEYDAAALSQLARRAFPEACIAGCTTAGEIAGRMLTGSVAGIFLDDEIVEDAATVVVENLGGGIDLQDALAKLEGHFGAARGAWDRKKYVGLVLVDGLSGAEERLMEKLGDATDVFFVGGSAGDDLKFKATRVWAGGEARGESAVLMVLRLRRGFEILKAQSFRTTGKSLVATAVDEAHRTVIEFDHKPALEAYAEVLGVPPAAAPGRFFSHPLGLMVRGEPYVRSPQQADGSSVVFYCQIKQGMRLDVLEATDIVADTRRALEACKNAGGEIRGLIEFQCILRTLQLRQEKRCQEYEALFAGIPTAGFSTYGEEYLGHMNQTSTMLLFR